MVKLLKSLLSALTFVLPKRRSRRTQKRPSVPAFSVYAPSDSPIAADSASPHATDYEAAVYDLRRSDSAASTIVCNYPSKSLPAESWWADTAQAQAISAGSYGTCSSGAYLDLSAVVHELQRTPFPSIDWEAAPSSFYAALQRFEEDRIYQNRCGFEHGQFPGTLISWVYSQSSPFGPQPSSIWRSMSWPHVWLDDQGEPVYVLGPDAQFTGLHSSHGNLPVPGDHVEDPFPPGYACAPDYEARLRSATRRGKHGVDDDGDNDDWAAGQTPHIFRGPTGDAQHSWRMNGSQRYVYGCTLSVVVEEKGFEEDPGIEVCDKASAESASSGVSSEMLSDCCMTADSASRASHTGLVLSNDVHTPAERQLSIEVFSDDESFYDAPSHLGSPLPGDWSSDAGYEPAEAGSDESALDAEICSAVHCRREESVITDDGSRFSSSHSESRRPSLATDTSRRPSFATSHESVSGSRRSSIAPTEADAGPSNDPGFDADSDDEDDMAPPVSPTTGDMLLRIWKRGDRFSLLMLDPSAFTPPSAFPDPPPSPAVPPSPSVSPSPGAASSTSAARPESMLLPDEWESVAHWSESSEQFLDSLYTDSEDDEGDLLLATLKDFDDEASISYVTARVYLAARIAPAQLVYYDMMLAASETVQQSRQVRGLHARGSLKTIQVHREAYPTPPATPAPQA